MATYREVRSPGSRWLVLEGWEESLPLPDRPDGWTTLPGTKIRKASRKKSILSVQSDAGPLIVKLFQAPRGLRRLLSPFGPSPAFREIAVYQELASSGADTSLPVAAGERRGAGFLGASCLVVQPTPTAMPLDLLLLDGKARGGWRRRLLEAYGAFAGRVHDCGVLQEDFDPNNSIETAGEGNEPKIRLVDMERVTIGEKLSREVRARNLARLYRYGRGLPRTEQIRFLRGYLPEGSRAREALRGWLEAIRKAWPGVVERDRLRMQRNAVRRGRLFSPIRRGKIRGFHRVRFGEREAPIFEATHLDPALALLEKRPLPGESIQLGDPILTRVGPFQARLDPCPPGDPPSPRARWQEANAAMKEGPERELPLALLEVRASLFESRGFLLVIRSEAYRPPSR